MAVRTSPFLSKGRFKEVFDDLIVVMKQEDVLPAKRLGSVVAVAMIAHASHAKARVAACQDCARCVEELGLSGIGKKGRTESFVDFDSACHARIHSSIDSFILVQFCGSSGVLVAAKALSEETLSENRAACLDLMELVLSRMNGYVSRLSRICGSSLSDKARRLVEERWSRRNKESSTPRLSDDSIARRSKIPTPKKASPSEKVTPSSMASASKPLIPPSSKSFEGSTSAILRDELPALVLRPPRGTESSTKETIGGARESKFGGSSRDFLANFQPSTESLGFNFSVASILHEEDSGAGKVNTNSFTSSSSALISQYNNKHNSEIASTFKNQNERRESFGAAASLRARLLKIREKSRNPESAYSTSSPEGTKPLSTSSLGSQITLSSIPKPIESQAEVAALPRAPTCTNIPSGINHGADVVCDEYISGMQGINQILSKATPLEEGDKDLDFSIECMKKFHAALSKQQNVVAGIEGEALVTLRKSIAANVDEVIEQMSR